MKKIFTLIVVALLGMSQVWGISKTQLTVNISGSGQIKVNTSSAQPSDWSSSSVTKNQEHGGLFDIGITDTYYIWVNPTAGYYCSGVSDCSWDNNGYYKISIKGTTTTEKKTVTVTFVGNSYKVTFNGNGSTGGSMADESFVYGTSKALTANAFSREYAITYNADGGDCAETDATTTYSFGGWAKSANGSVVFGDGESLSKPSPLPAHNSQIDLYATWTGGAVELPYTEKAGLLFDGWYDGETWAGNIGDNYIATADVELTAHWAEKRTPVFKLDKDEIELGQTAVLTMSNVNNPTIEITPTGIVEYDSETGILTGIGVGDVTISATQEETAELAYKQVDLVLTVTRKTPSLSVVLNGIEQSSVTIYQGGTGTASFSKVSDAEVNVEAISGGSSASYANGILTAGEIGTAVFRASLAETDTYSGISLEFTVKVEKNPIHLPMDFTKALWDNPTIKVGESGTNSWDGDNQVRLGHGTSGGWNYDDKWITVHFEGIPDKLTFEYKFDYVTENTKNTATWGSEPDPNLLYFLFVEESSDNSNWSALLWNSTDPFKDSWRQSGELQLKKTTRYLRFHLHANLGAYYRNIHISEIKYVDDPVPANIDFGSAIIYTGEVSADINVNWCNIAPLKVTCSNDRFTVTPSQFGNYDQYASQTIHVAYTHTSEVGDNEGDITISNGNDAYTKTIHVHAETTKRLQTVTWNTDLVATGFAMNVGEELTSIATTQNGEEITFSSSDESVIKVENGALVAVAAGTADITAYQAGDNEYAEVTDVQTFTVTLLHKQSITWDQNLRGLLTTSEPVDLIATATSNMEIEYTSGNEEVVRIENGNQLVVVGEGNTYITAYQAGGLDGEGEEWLPISLNNYVVVRNPNSPCEEMSLYVASYELHSGELSKSFDLTGTPKELTFTAKHGEKSGQWGGSASYAPLVVEQYAFINNSWDWYTVYNKVVGTSDTQSGVVALDESATKVRFSTGETAVSHTITNIQIPRKKFLRSSVDAIDENAEKNTIWQKTITISHSNIDLMTVTTEEGLLTLSTGTLGSGCGDFGDHSFIVSFTPTEKYVDYYDKIIITDGKATPSTIEIPMHLYSTGFNQTLNGFSLPSTCLTTEVVEMPVVTANTGLTPVEFLSSDSAIAYVENNVLKIFKAGSVDITAYQAGDDRYNEVSETKTIDIQLAPSTILQAPEALMIAVGSELSVSTLRNGQADVEGTFAWADGSEVLTTAGDFEREVIFVPSADTIYAPASVMVTVSVTDGAAITEYPTLSDIVYGQELGEAAIIGGAATVSGTFNLTSDPTDVYDAGDVDIYMVFTPDDPSYDEVPFIITLHIEQAEPEIYTYPTATDVEEGQTLAESLLDGGEASELGYFEWADNTVEPTVGTHDYEVLFVPDDMNYKAVSIWVSVHVNGTTTSLDEVEINAAATKVLRNGLLYIQRNGNTYSVQGKKIE